MKFLITRTSRWSDDAAPPVEGAVFEKFTRMETRTCCEQEFNKRFSAKEGEWRSRGTNHRTIMRKGEEWIIRDHAEGSEGWFLDFPDLESVLKFAHEHGQVILGKHHANSEIEELEIYDDYRE